MDKVRKHEGKYDLEIKVVTSAKEEIEIWNKRNYKIMKYIRKVNRNIYIYEKGIEIRKNQIFERIKWAKTV